MAQGNDEGAGLIGSMVIVGASADEPEYRDLSRLVEKAQFAPEPALALDVLAAARPDLVIISQRVPARTALDLLRRIQQVCAGLPVVVAAENPSVELAVQFVRAGAYDYFGGRLDSQRLCRLLEGMQAERMLRRGRQDRFFCEQCPSGVSFVGQSDGAVRALEMIRIVSESRCNPILILGETGTGKELAARAVHAWRCGEPEKFVAVNCAALTANLLESELFGHVKGAFTGADRDKTGLFELAQDGCILLDEISEMPPELQAKLLRVLQEKTFRKVGGTRDIECQATIIASSNRDPLADVAAGRFRRDLYYRLAVFPITIPPLRSPQRQDDIGLLAEYFVQTSSIPARKAVAGISPQAHRQLMLHSWPGNVRELRNVVDRAMILERSDQLTPQSLVIETHEQPPAAPASAGGGEFSLEAAEREFILRALKETGWQRTRAAALLGITRATLHAKLKRYDIKAPHGALHQPAPDALSGKG